MSREASQSEPVDAGARSKEMDRLVVQEQEGHLVGSAETTNPT
jgi:hypothetical protein